MLSKDVQDLLDKYQTLKFLKGNGKVKCKLSGHEMPCQAEAILSYVEGKKYKKLLAEKELESNDYKEHLVPSKKKGREHQYFCMLTWRHINRNPEHVTRHVEGRRFKKALVRWKECQKTGEKFQPNRGRPKHEPMDTDNALDKVNTDTDNDDEAESDVDSLSDLYPDKDFTNLEQEKEGEEGESSKVNHMGSDSDFDFEDMDVQGASNSIYTSSKNTKTDMQKGEKRKKEETQFKKKKKKKKS